MKNNELNNKRFILINEHIQEGEDDILKFERIFQVKITNYGVAENSVMLQIVDISQSIKLNQKTVENEMLNIVNATVSHELRNPLSAICSQNLQKKAILQRIKLICVQNKYFDIIHGLSELEDSTKIQMASARIMSFLIQDLLDYAQMKTGKFRVNIKDFNIREAFEEVMSIQREQAIAKGVSLEVKYVNICKGLNVLEDY